MARLGLCRRVRVAPDLLPTRPDAATLAGLEASPITQGAIYGDAENFHRFMIEEFAAAYRRHLRDRSPQQHPVG